jgi:hypothetical protein
MVIHFVLFQYCVFGEVLPINNLTPFVISAPLCKMTALPLDDCQFKEGNVGLYFDNSVS